MINVDFARKKKKRDSFWGDAAARLALRCAGILTASVLTLSGTAFAWEAPTAWENSATENVSLDENNDYEAEETLLEEAPEGEEVVETDDVDVNLPNNNVLESRETHRKHIDAVSAFRQVIDKTEFGATITTVGQQSDFGATDSGIDGSLMVELKAKAKLTERDTVRATFKAGMGEGLGERIPSFCGFNAASGTGRNIYLNQLWYERKFGDGDRWRARVGYLDLTSDFDANAYANDEYCQFLSDAFVNNLTFECTANSLGGQIWWEPNDKWSVGAGYAESDRDCREMFSNGVAIFEVDRRVDFGELQGTYRGYVTANFGPHEALDGSDDDLTNAGWGLSFDQEISRNVGLWGRYGQQNGECNEFDRALTAGFELHSLSEKRPDDVLGFGYGIMFVSDEFKELNENAIDENHFELYYSFQVNEYFSATPSLQWIDGVGGDGDAEVVWTPGLRATVAF